MSKKVFAILLAVDIICLAANVYIGNAFGLSVSLFAAAFCVACLMEG